MKRLRLAVIIGLVMIFICRTFEPGYGYQIPQILDSIILDTADNLNGSPMNELKGQVSSSIRVEGVDGRFKKNTFQVGGVIGAGYGTKICGSEQSHDLASASANFGWVFTGVMAPGHWYSGNLELLTELFGGGQFYPDAAYFAGLTPFLRYNFSTAGSWMPFVEAGAGVSLTDIGHDLTGRFQFNLQGGAGVHRFFNEGMALTVQYRWLHFSNAGTKCPNNGVNTQMLLFGFTRFWQ